MTLYILLPLTLLVFLFFHYTIMPRVKKAQSNNRWVAKIGKPALLAVVKYVHTLLFTATLTYALLVLVTLTLSMTNAASSEGFQAAITRIQSYRASLALFKSYWGLAVFAFIFIVITLILFRRFKEKMMELEREKLRLNDEGEVGEWEFLEPTPEMDQLAENIYAAQLLLNSLDASTAPQTKETQAAKAKLTARIRQLRVSLHDLDLERRAHSNLEGRQEQTGSASRGESRIRTFFGSKGLLESVQGIGRVTGYVGLMLLCLSLVGVSTPLVDQALARRVVYLSDLQVKANQLEARDSFGKLLAAQADEGKRELTKDDEEALHQLSRLFEQAFTSSYVWGAFNYSDSSFQIRKDLVREQIIIVHWDPPSESASWRKDGPPGPEGPGPGGAPNPNNPDGGGGRDPNNDRRPGPGPGNASPNKPKRDGGGPDGRPSLPKTPRGRDGKESETGQQPKEDTVVARDAYLPLKSDETRSRLGSAKGPQTRIGERFASDVRTGIVYKSKKFWGRIKGSLAVYASKFREPLDSLEFGKWVSGEMMGGIVDSVWQQMPGMGEIGEPLKGAVKAGFKDAAKTLPTLGSSGQDLTLAAQRLYDLSFQQFMTDVGEGIPLEQALARVEAGVAERPVASIEDAARLREVSRKLLSSSSFEDLEKSFKDNPPTLPDPQGDVVAARKAAATLEKSLNAERITSLPPEEFNKIYVVTDTYEDHFPGSGGAHETTARQKLRAKLSDKAPDTALATRLSGQSRDFSQLKLASDIGGVLIGRAPDKSADGMDFRDLSWTLSGDKVTLRLQRADGSAIVLGPFSQDIVNNALVYVADDRKAVVTIQSAFWDDKKNAWHRRILLHPALVDTPLGKEMIEFDELVFKLTKGDPQRKAAEQPMHSQLALYNLAWRYRRIAVRELILERETDAAKRSSLETKIEEDTETIKKLLAHPRNATDLSLGLGDVKTLRDPQASLLAKYSVYFDANLVRMIADCGGSDQAIEKFGRCVQAWVRSDASNGISKEVVAKILAAPVQTSPRSIAEEMSFSLDNELTFLSPENVTRPYEELWPFEFRYEIAFPVNAAFLSPGDEQGNYREPWEYQSLRTLIADRVSQGVKSDPEIRELFARVRGFTALQRLFRVSLQGGMGKQFPIEKLVDLTKTTAGYNGKDTPRWEIKVAED